MKTFKFFYCNILLSFSKINFDRLMLKFSQTLIIFLADFVILKVNFGKTKKKKAIQY